MATPSNETTLNEIQGSFRVIQSQYVDAYVCAKQSMANLICKQRLSTLDMKYEQLVAQLFTLNKNVQYSIQSETQRLSHLYTSISEEKTKNKTLASQLSDTKTNEQTASLLIEDYKKKYNTQYIHNWALFLSAVGVAAFVMRS